MACKAYGVSLVSGKIYGQNIARQTQANDYTGNTLRNLEIIAGSASSV